NPPTAQLWRPGLLVPTFHHGFPDFRGPRGGPPPPPHARSVRALQERGLADPELDADLAAAALSSMVSRTAYNAFVVGAERDVERLAHTLTRL
ncbi:hypothetical protein, partial [Mumia sp.]|uniref:hypothetical protein n=1 Tax=Mumia sp. TaxID=1965300 RepID=UPI0026026B72